MSENFPPALPVVESQRDSINQPRVGRTADYPGSTIQNAINPEGVAAPHAEGATPLGLKTFATETQGSSSLATLGWMIQSRWDCKRGEKAGLQQGSFTWRHHV